MYKYDSKTTFVNYEEGKLIEISKEDYFISDFQYPREPRDFGPSLPGILLLEEKGGICKYSSADQSISRKAILEHNVPFEATKASEGRESLVEAGSDAIWFELRVLT